MRLSQPGQHNLLPSLPQVLQARGEAAQGVVSVQVRPLWQGAVHQVSAQGTAGIISVPVSESAHSQKPILSMIECVTK